ncbi:translation initiation factor IF-3 [Candidatus Microgenomates bacterium]|nr:translation initiation factor IF-3 [Candidatus Microgenomates bacterium]
MIKQYKVNSQIDVPQVRLISEEGKQVGVLDKDEALDYALGQGKDMVLIGETAKPPVAKVIDFKKFLYQEQKKEAENRKGQRGTGTKEIRVGGPFAGTADVEARINRTREYLEKGFNVKISIKFSGRQMSHPEFGHKILNQFKESLVGKGKVEREAKFEGKQLIITFSPSK